MTNIKIFKNKGDIYCVDCSGHTGYAEYGSDILCSSISSIVQSAVIGVQEVAKLTIKLNINEEKGKLKFKLNLKDRVGKKSNFDVSQYILKTMFLSLKNLASNYANYMKLEVIEDDYD